VAGTLYIVSTPIGNLEDITLRALRILGEVDLIAAEDTRHSLKLLNHYGISKPVISYWGERERIRSEEIIRKLQAGKTIALISDAGTPGISDPGAVVVRKALEEDIRVVPVPGPSALIAALSLSGLPTDVFTFIGFLPAKKAMRQKVLKDLSLEKSTLIFYEAPHRIMETLTDMGRIFADRKAVLVKEITKIHEEVLRGRISEIIGAIGKTKIAGEYVIIMEGRSGGNKVTITDALEEIDSLMKKGLKRKEAVKKIAADYGLSSKELYRQSLDKIP
jgi:16S rRNA (cytidine1402-2'-O)-methyltransferase